MILLCPPEKSTQFHYPLDPKKIRAEGSMHKDTTYQGSDRQDFYRHGKKKLKKRKKRKQTNKTQTSTGFAVGNQVTIIDVKVNKYGYTAFKKSRRKFQDRRSRIKYFAIGNKFYDMKTTLILNHEYKKLPSAKNILGDFSCFVVIVLLAPPSIKIAHRIQRAQ